jgi:hypothetical protein
MNIRAKRESPLMKGRSGRRGEEPVLEDREVEHRRRAAVLDEDEDGQQDRRGGQAGDHQRVVPAGDPPAGDPVDEAGQPDHEADGATEVEAADAVAAGELAEDEGPPEPAGQGQRHVEPEDPVPGDRDQGAAEDGTDDEADRGDHRVRPHRQPELLAREGVGDQRRAVGEDEGAADPLQDPPEDQLGPVGGEAGAEGGEAEDREGADEGRLAPEEIGEPPGGEHQHGRGDHVGEDHPDQFEEIRPQRPLQIRQGDDQRPGVGRHQQHPETGAGERPPLVMRLVHTQSFSYVHVN